LLNYWWNFISYDICEYRLELNSWYLVFSYKDW
jgi:hypothetical protein